MVETYRIELPIRRYAIFGDLLLGYYTVLIRGDDVANAPNWVGFVKWSGGVKPAITITNDRKVVAMTDNDKRARELLEQFQRIGDAPPELVLMHCDRVLEAITAALREVPEWQPIETAPEGRLVVVGWLDAEDSHYPENYEFDYLEDGLWAKHEDCVEHAHAVAPPGSKMPKEQPPYQWWIDLPAFPAARPQGVK